MLGAVEREALRSQGVLQLGSREVASGLTSRFLNDIRSDGDWSVAGLDVARVRAPDGEWETLTVVEITRKADGAVGYATLTGEAPGDAAQLVFVEQLHDVVLEESSGAAVPECPGHSHPQSPRVADGVLTWHCPVALGQVPL